MTSSALTSRRATSEVVRLALVETWPDSQPCPPGPDGREREVVLLSDSTRTVASPIRLLISSAVCTVLTPKYCCVSKLLRKSSAPSPKHLVSWPIDWKMNHSRTP